MNETDEILEEQDSLKVLDASPLSEVDIPVKADNRKLTDLWFLIVFVLFTILVVPFVIYTLSYSSIWRLNGDDRCGNICGRKNDKIEGLDCSGQDMTNKPIVSDECIPKEQFVYSPYRGYTGQVFTEYFQQSIWKFILLCLLPLGLSFALAKFLQHATVKEVWILLTGSWLSLVAITLLPWMAIAPAVITALPGIAAIILMCMVIFNGKKVNLVTLVLRESAKAVCKHGVIASVAIAAFFLETAILLPCIIINLCFSTAGKVFVSEYKYVYYIMDNYMIATIILYALLVAWAIHFVIGIQNMIVSGAVIRGYFSRGQINAKEAVLKSFSVTVRNHLGTAALQSLLSLIVAPILTFLFPLKLFSVTTDFVDTIFKYTDAFFTRNLCIVTAMHGTSYFQSGRKAVKLSEASIGDTIAIEHLSDFVISLLQMIVICICLIITYFIIYNPAYEYYAAISCLFILGFSYISTNSILESVKTASATVHLCVAQDCLIDKQEAKPYNMSLEKFLDCPYELFATKTSDQTLPTTNET